MEKQIKQVLDILEDNGFEAYLVGGYVRDALLGISSKDIDICTNALPKDIHNLFHSVDSNYGSVNLKTEKYNIDITTFRMDLNYVNRRPSEVKYIDSLEEDLTRRDFTINTICMDSNGKIIDHLNGVEDLNNRIIRSVGNPSKKLVEDPLRILRAIRFATVLDFDIENKLMKELKSNAHLVNNLSKTRVRGELDKILLSKNYQKGLDLLKELGILDMFNITFDNIFYVDDIHGMWAQIKFGDIPFTNNEKSNIIKIADVVRIGNIDFETLYNYGLYVCTIAGKILNISTASINELYNNMSIKVREDIDITSNEIKEIVGTGKVIGETYKLLEKMILEKKLDNKNSEIKDFLNSRE